MVTQEEILIGSVLIFMGVFAPMYIYLKRRHLLKNKRYRLWLIADIAFCLGLGLQFIFRINP